MTYWSCEMKQWDFIICTCSQQLHSFYACNLPSPLYILSCTCQLHSLIWMWSPGGSPKEESVSLKAPSFLVRGHPVSLRAGWQMHREPQWAQSPHVHLQILPIINFKHFKSAFEDLNLPSKAAYTYCLLTLSGVNMCFLLKKGWCNQRQALVPECQPKAPLPCLPSASHCINLLTAEAQKPEWF